MGLFWSLDAPAPGAVQMQQDRQMLERAAADGTILLRVYGFAPRAISLGYHQSIEQVDTPRAHRDGVDVVRRPTGGAAVLHDEEWTYAAAGAWAAGGLHRPRAVYDVVAESLRHALAAVGVATAPGGHGAPSGAVCFEAAGGHELVVNGRKLVGSALRTDRSGWLQHGSVLIGPGHLDLVEYLRLAPGPRGRLRRRMARRTVGLAELCQGNTPSRADFARTLAGALAQRLSLACSEVGPSGLARAGA